MSAPKDDALAAAVAEHGPFPMPVGTADVDPVRGPLWSLLDWSLWGAGLGDTFREPLADAMLGAVPAEMVAQAEAVMAEFIERRRIEKTGVTVYQEQRAEVDRLRAERAQLQDDITGACLARHEEEQENERLRARVAELEAARTTAAADRDKQIIAWLEKKGREEGTRNKDSRVRATATFRLADKLSRGAVYPACPPVSPEDPHDSPLHHSYAVGRDLPEVKAESPAESVARWNAAHFVGTPVTAYPGRRPEDDPKCVRLITHTRSAASVLGGHTAVVWVEGHGACIKLTHVDPRPGGAL